MIFPAVVSPILRRVPTRKQAAIIFGISTGILFVLFIAAIMASDTEPSPQTATVSEQPQVTPMTSTQATASPGATGTTEDAIKQVVADQLKGQTTDKKDKLKEVVVTPIAEDNSSYLVRVAFNADENLTTNLTKKGIEYKMAELHKALYTSGQPIGRVVIQAYQTLVDSYGNNIEGRVYETSLDKSEVDKINWSADESSLKFQIIPGVWTVSYIHSIYR